MKINRSQLVLVSLIIICLFFVDPMYAGPGGYIAKGLFKTFWGKLILALLTIILLPLILYVSIVEGLKVRKNKKILQKLSIKHKDFKWLTLEKEFKNCITRVYLAWYNEDMSEVKNNVNHWYWQNQQLVYLDRWKKENLKNVSRLKGIKKMKPIYLELSEEANLNGTRIAISVDVEAEDYLVERDTNKVIEGKKGIQDLEYVWLLEYNDGKWLLDDIQEGKYSFQFAKMPNEIPDNLRSVVLS